MNKKSLIIAFVLSLLLAFSVQAENGVNQLTMNHQNNETVLKIDISGAFQFAHQSEIAKDGKPYRVIVDLFPAVHLLGQKNFSELPACIVSSIRTSQYSIKPEQVVRIVLDLKDESIYRIEKKGNSIYVSIPDKSAADFMKWQSSAKVTTASSPAPVAVAQKQFENAGVKNKKQEPSAPEKKTIITESAKAAGKKGPVVTSVMPPKIATYHSPQKSSFIDEEMNQLVVASQAPAVSKSASQPRPEAKKSSDSKTKNAPQFAAAEKSDRVKKSSKPPIETAKQAKPIVNNKANKKPAPKAGTPDTAAEKADPVKMEDIKKSPTPAEDGKTDKKKEKPFKKKKQTVAKKSSAPIPQPAKQDTQSESDKALAKKSKTAKPTSRFRRSPSMPAKLKGTIVAQFPTRMVIKYKPGISRDPFATLIDETRQTDSPVRKKTPDVETLRLVGVLESSGGKNRALLEDIDGYGYILKQGDKVKKGYVSRIDSQKAYFQLFEYGWNRTVALELGHE